MKRDQDSRPLSPETIALKVSKDLAVAIRSQARADDRTVSGYLRRLLTTVVLDHHDGESR